MIKPETDCRKIPVLCILRKKRRTVKVFAFTVRLGFFYNLCVLFAFKVICAYTLNFKTVVSDFGVNDLYF